MCCDWLTFDFCLRRLFVFVVCLSDLIGIWKILWCDWLIYVIFSCGEIIFYLRLKNLI